MLGARKCVLMIVCFGSMCLWYSIKFDDPRDFGESEQCSNIRFYVGNEYVARGRDWIDLWLCAKCIYCFNAFYNNTILLVQSKL